MQLACKHTDAQKAQTAALDVETQEYLAQWGGADAVEAYRVAANEGVQRSQAYSEYSRD